MISKFYAGLPGLSHRCTPSYQDLTNCGIMYAESDVGHIVSCSSGRKGVMGERLRNPPLVEALLEMRWRLSQREPSTPPIDPAYPIVVGLLYDKVKDRFSCVEELPQSRFPHEMLQFSMTHRFRIGPAEWPLVQIGPGIASVNYTTSYTWDEFRTAACEFIDHLTSAYKVAVNRPPDLEQVTLRYLNAIEFEAIPASVLSFLREQLRVGFDVPIPVAAVSSGVVAPDILRLQIGYRLERPHGVGILSVNTGRRNKQLTLFWDMGVVSAGEDVPDFEDFPQWLSSAHEVAENWFFALIEGTLHEEFKGSE